MKYLGKIEHDKDLINQEYARLYFIEKYETLPTASAEYEGKIVQYIGASTSEYTRASFYECKNDGTGYVWEIIETSGYLPLTGGTLTGDLAVTSGSGSIKASTDDEFIVVSGASTYAYGAWIQLIGKDYSSNKGEFFIAANNGNTTKMLVGSPNGTLKWDDSNLLNQDTADERYLKLTGGTLTGSLNVKAGGSSIKANVDNSMVEIYGANHYDNGAYLALYGKNSSTNEGGFCLVAKGQTRSDKGELKGYPDGRLTWNGKSFATVSDSTPTLTARSGWTMWGQCTPICGNLYYLNYTFKNDTGSIQGASDLPIADCNGSAGDCAFATACYEALDSVIGCVMQTNILKFRTSANKIPIGAYIPVSGVLSWTP